MTKILLLVLVCISVAYGDNHGDASQKYVIAWMEPSFGLIVKVVGDGTGHPRTFRTTEEAIAEAHRMADERNEPFVVLPMVLPRYK